LTWRKNSIYLKEEQHLPEKETHADFDLPERRTVSTE
jgi:hypothetical protein